MSLLQVSDLHKSFGGVRAVDGVSLAVAAGELLALIGPNGAGKSTLFNLLNGQLRPDQGQIRMHGKLLNGLSPCDIWRQGVGRTFQVSQTFASLTVMENVQMVLLSSARRLYSLWTRAAGHQPQRALALLEQVGMASQAGRACSELAYGDVKRVELAMALASEPQLLLMDEPTAGMAPEERHALMALTRRLAAERRMAVLFTEHSMDVVFGYAHRVVVLARGRILAQGDPRQVQQHPEVQQEYLGVGPAFAHRSE
jgi:branched-chain amino acid transport system ATP-binding protein